MQAAVLNVRQNRCSKKFRYIHKEIPMIDSFFNEDAGLSRGTTKITQVQVFLSEFYENLRATASALIISCFHIILANNLILRNVQIHLSEFPGH